MKMVRRKTRAGLVNLVEFKAKAVELLGPDHRLCRILASTPDRVSVETALLLRQSLGALIES
jgi:hypothetical protein